MASTTTFYNSDGEDIACPNCNARHPSLHKAWATYASSDCGGFDHSDGGWLILWQGVTIRDYELDYLADLFGDNRSAEEIVASNYCRACRFALSADTGSGHRHTPPPPRVERDYFEDPFAEDDTPAEVMTEEDYRYEQGFLSGSGEHNSDSYMNYLNGR